MKQGHLWGIDIVKIIAAVMVTCVHFYYRTGFYSAIPISGPEYIFPISVLWIFYTCVPLFMITTGYLMTNKTLSAKYYTGLIRILVFYLICSTASMFFRRSAGAEFTLWTALRGYLQFNMCDYAWYVEQYITVFCMIPFLNLAYHGLKSKGQKLVLTGTACVLFMAAPSLYLGFDPNDQIKLLPLYALRAYPIAYYYIGSFLREYPPKRCLKIS